MKKSINCEEDENIIDVRIPSILGIAACNKEHHYEPPVPGLYEQFKRMLGFGEHVDAKLVQRHKEHHYEPPVLGLYGQFKRMLGLDDYVDEKLVQRQLRAVRNGMCLQHDATLAQVEEMLELIINELDETCDQALALKVVSSVAEFLKRVDEICQDKSKGFILSYWLNHSEKYNRWNESVGEFEKKYPMEMSFIPKDIDALKAIGERQEELARGKMGFFRSGIKDGDAQGSTFTQSQFPSRP